MISPVDMHGIRTPAISALSSLKLTDKILFGFMIGEYFLESELR